MKDDRTMHSSAGSGTGCASWRRCRSRGRSAWLEGRVLALFRLGEHVHALDGVDPWPASPCWGVAWWGMPVGSPWWPRRCTSSATP